MKPLFLVLTLCGLAAGAAHAAEDSPTAYTALRLVGKELGADSLGRIVAVGGREGVPQPFVWRVTLAPKPGGDGGAREVEVAGGRIVSNRPAREVAAGTPTIELKNLNLDSSGAFSAADAESRRLHLPFSAINYDLRADPAAGNRPTWTVQLLDGDHRPVGSLLLAATDGTQVKATGQLVEGAPRPGSSAVVASTSTDEPSAAEPRGPRRSRTTTTITTTTRRTAAEPREEPEGGFLERAGRTLDRTPGRIGNGVESGVRAAEHGVRRAGANVGVTIQRFFEPDARRE